MTISGLGWKQLQLSPKELSLARVLRCGQAFRWKNIDGVWSCALANRVVFLKQSDTMVEYATLPELAEGSLAFIQDYFQLAVSAEALYNQWSLVDKHFRTKQEAFQGIRILRQDPWECLVSFICSSNNNVKRISQMCDNLCLHYGDKVALYQGVDYFAFPPPERLVSDTIEAELRALGFGYRAKYIEKTARLIHLSPTGVDELVALRNVGYAEAREALLRYTGVGPKVADCVALMSLDKHDVVPVDTHVYQIAKRDYKFKGKGDTVTPQINQMVGDLFRALWGDYAGWAHSVLFAADLRNLENGVNTANGVEVKGRSRALNKVGRPARADVSKETVKLEGVDERVKLEGVDDRIKLEGVDERVKLEGVDERVKLEGVDERVKLEGVDERVKLEDIKVEAELDVRYSNTGRPLRKKHRQ